MTESTSGNITIMGLLLQGAKYDKRAPLLCSDWLWVTTSQWEQMIGNQNKVFLVDDHVIFARDVKIAKRFTLQELKSQPQNWEIPDYLEERLREEASNET